MNITEDYVSFETAKLLNESGFQKEYPFTPCYKQPTGEFINYPTTFDIEHYSFLSAPTLQMAMKWLREVHNLHIAVNICYTENPKLFQPNYYVYVSSTTTGESLIKEKCTLVQDKSLTPKEFISYEQACEAAIKYCLENLI